MSSRSDEEFSHKSRRQHSGWERWGAEPAPGEPYCIFARRENRGVVIIRPTLPDTLNYTTPRGTAVGRCAELGRLGGSEDPTD
jgi:hypothetical protein